MNNIEDYLTPEEKFNRDFRILKLIGHGISKVYKVRTLINNVDHRESAIKVKQFDFQEFQSAINEYEILLNLDPNYVLLPINCWIERHRIEFQAQNEYSLYLQTKLYSILLKDAINIINNEKEINRFSPENFYTRRDIFVQLLESVNHLHSNNPSILHLDLKPENIMLDISNNDRFLKLIDFGLAIYVTDVNLLEGFHVGTSFYRAPEVNDSHYTTKADMYAIGIIGLQLFNIDLDSETDDVDDSILEDYLSIKQLCESLLKPQIRDRPSCDEIFNNNIWIRNFRPINLSIFINQFF